MNFICRQCRATHNGEYRESCPACLAKFSLARVGYRRPAKTLLAASDSESAVVIQREGSFEQLVETKPFEGRRASTGFASIDNVLGRNEFGRYAEQAGVSRQGVILVSGAAGLGKTALLYEWLAKFRRDGIRCAFISAEQQANAIRAAVIRLGLDDDLRTMSVLCTGDLAAAMAKVAEANIEIVVLDSLNKIKDPTDPTKGEAAKVNIINRLIEDAWRDEEKPRTWLVVSQMNKDGELRGSEELIHDSDATLLLQKSGIGDQIVIAMPDKNRFGSHGRTRALFRMNDRGKMIEILPPASLPPVESGALIPATTVIHTTTVVAPAVDIAEVMVAPIASYEPPSAPLSGQLDLPDDSDDPAFKNETPLVAAARALNDGRAFEGSLAASVRRREARVRGGE